MYYTNILFGYLFAEEECYLGSLGYHTLSGGTFGIGGYWGFDYLLTEHLSFGASLGFVLGKPIDAKIIMNDGEQQLKTINPNHFDLTAGIRYYF